MKSRELDFGWVPTINGFDEKSFPLGIKQVSMKELAVIFPSALIAIMFFSRNLLIAMASLVPALYIFFYDEKSMSEFQFVYYFLRSYLSSTKKTSTETTGKAKTTEKHGYFDFRIIMKYKIDIITLVLGIVLDLMGIRFLSVSLSDLLISLILLSIGSAFIISETLLIQLQRMKKRQREG
ncbi:MULTISPECIES: hypothetical protein [Sulfolobaceae]|uniref:Uncharacterized protein n=1 Tax=Sulfolobus tengchongensis TaxID=207809 RepID=Q6H0X9_9CREN|nr:MULTISPECIES: hypothetical protein [Sulfolobaceae]AAT46514.1 hypothetical protein [Sulfolobus tengchongensis]MCP6728449.1 hypothetical protein [Metallosphaera sedula]